MICYRHCGSTIQRSPAHENPAAEGLEPVPKARLISVDALRGFDMFWIIGAGAVVHALDAMKPNAVTLLVRL